MSPFKLLSWLCRLKETVTTIPVCIASRRGGILEYLHTEVQRVSFVGSTNQDCHPHPLCNLQNLQAVPPYEIR